MFPLTLTLTLTLTSAAELARLQSFLEGAAPPAPAAKPEKPAKPAAPAVQEAAKTAAQAAEAPAPTPEGPLDYAVLQKAVFRLAQKAPAKCQAACEKMGVKTMRDLAPEKRRDALAIVEKFIDEVGA